MGSRCLVIGDIHGRFHALVEVLELSNFDFDSDKLIILGDVVDGGYYTKACIELLRNIKNRVLICGNHDVWALNWFLTGRVLDIWYHQGGINTMRAYDNNHRNVPQSHIDFLKSSQPYFIDSLNRVFVHGGFNPFKPISSQSPYELMWDRALINYARGGLEAGIDGINIPNFSMVFVGHTTTQLYGGVTTPLMFNNLVMLDTGAGWSGKLTIMDVDSLKYYQSQVQLPPSCEKYMYEINNYVGCLER